MNSQMDFLLEKRHNKLLRNVITKGGTMSADTSNNNSDEWSIACFPDNEDFEPTPEELESMYVGLDNGNIPELLWKCPGRRAPSPLTKEEPKVAENVEKEPAAANTDFDFMDDVALPTMRVRSQNTGPKGSAKKKTANFAGVMDALKKQLSQNKESSNS